MELMVIQDGKTITTVATPENIIRELQDAYAHKNEAVVLIDPINNQFMQTAYGWHIEYQVDLIHYFVDHVPLEVTAELFLSFINNDLSWKSGVNWQVDAEITASVQAAMKAGLDVKTDIASDTDFRIKDDDDLYGTMPLTTWAPDFFKTWKQLIKVSRKKVDKKSVIYRWDWSSLIDPIWEINPIVGGHHWRDEILPDLRQEFDELVPVAEGLATEMEVLFWKQQLHNLSLQPISSISTMRSMLRDTLGVEKFLTDKLDAFPDLQDDLRKVKERFAWYRAKKKVNEAEIAEALGDVRKSEKLRVEAGIMLRQDWPEVFSGEEVPKETVAKVREIRSDVG